MNSEINHSRRISDRRAANRSHGLTIIWMAVTMVIFLGLLSLAVDMARLQVAKSQAQAAADAAALYAAEGIVGGTPTLVRNRAVAAAADNKIDGVPAVVDPNLDVAFGTWDPVTRTFALMPAGQESAATAIQVSIHRDASRGNPIPLTFGALIGISSTSIDKSAIASLGKVTESTVPAAASPWLAGMPTGSTIPNTGGNPTPAYAGINSPPEIATTGGTNIRFAAVGGNTSWISTSGDGSESSAGAGGDTTFIAAQAEVNGINTTKAPLNAMMGIFLDNTEPDMSAPAAQLDFSTAQSRDFTTLSPGLKQVFYIGTGVNSSGQLQTFVAPPGATRLFLGTMDEEGWWWDNVGSLNFTAVQGNDAVLVR
jgi:Flp pilus assembly protein TadG